MCSPRPTPLGDSPDGALPQTVALTAWCEEHNCDPSDEKAPHVQAFLAGYGAGHDDGWDEGNEHATEYLRNGGTLR